MSAQTPLLLAYLARGFSAPFVFLALLMGGLSGFLSFSPAPPGQAPGPPWIFFKSNVE